MSRINSFIGGLNRDGFLGFGPNFLNNALTGGLLGGALQFGRGLPVIGDLIGGLMQFGVPFAQAQDFADQQREANEANLARFEEGRGLLQGVSDRGDETFQRVRDELRHLQSRLNDQSQRNLQADRGELGALRDDVLGRLQGDLSQNLAAFQGFRDPLLAGFRQREQDVLGELEGLGTRAREDINRRFDAAGGNRLADLQSRGLRGSTIVGGELRANERERSRSLGDLDESIRAQRADAISRLRGDTLATQGNTGLAGLDIGRLGRAGITGAAADFGGQNFGLGFNQRLGQLGRNAQFGGSIIDQFTNRLNFNQGAINNLVNFIANRVDQGPDANLLNAQLMGLGRASTPMPEGPDPMSGIGGQLAGAGMQAGLGFLGNALLPGIGGFLGPALGGLFGGGGGGGGGASPNVFQMGFR